MTIKSVIVCDFCGKEVDQSTMIETSAAPYEECSQIFSARTKESYSVMDCHYCGLNCLFAQIEIKLEEMDNNSL